MTNQKTASRTIVEGLPDTVNRRVLLLNASEEVLRMISWQRAVTMLWGDKAHSPYNFDHHYTIQVMMDKEIFPYEIPSAIVLNDYVQVPYRHIRPTRENIFLRDNMTCQYTGKKLCWKDATIDHIIPRSKGGKHEWGNVTTSERNVNIRKADRTPEQAGLKLLSKPVQPTHGQLVINSASQEQRESWARWMS